MNTVPKIDPKQATPVTAPGIHSRMVAILRDLDAIGKDKKTTMSNGGNFNYRGIDDVYNAINPLLARHGVYMTAEVLGKTREERQSKTGGVLAFTCLRMRYHFHAEDGSSVHTEAEGEGMDSGDKSSNKGMAVAHKYALLQAFCVPTKDMDDPDAQSHEVAASKPSAAAPKPTAASITEASEQDQDGQVTNWVNQQKAFITECTATEFLKGWKKRNDAAMGRLETRNPKLWNELMDHYANRYEELYTKEKQ